MVTQVFGRDKPGFQIQPYDRFVQCPSRAGFRHPMDLAVNSEGLIYVVNRSYEEAGFTLEAVRVNTITMDDDFGGEFGQYGTGDGEFIMPIAIAIDSQDNFYVADEWLNRISVFDKNGNFQDKWGIAGSKKGELNRPTGIRLDKEGNLYLVDSFNNRVQIFTKDGELLDTFGKEGSGDGSLICLGGSAWTIREMCMWRTGGTTAFRSLRGTGISSANSDPRETCQESSTAPQV